MNETPIFVESYFQITDKHIEQALYFHYYDPDEVYYRFKQTGAIKGELENIQSNLQLYLDEDDLFVDKLKKRMTVKKTQLYFRSQNKILPSLSFVIISEEYNISSTTKFQVELHTQPEKLPYPAISIWKTHIGKFSNVISKTFHKIENNRRQVGFYMNTGDTIGGIEQFTIEKKV
ncbi:MAG: hypothetical protein ACTSW1_08735 [Candidatus Hodarchaeales archaeon]